MHFYIAIIIFHLQEPKLSEFQKKRHRNIKELNEMKQSLKFQEVQILQQRSILEVAKKHARSEKN